MSDKKYVGDPEQSVSTLLGVSISVLYGGDRFRDAAAKVYDKELLGATKNQAEQGADSIRYLLESLGVWVSIANESENMPREAMMKLA